MQMILAKEKLNFFMKGDETDMMIFTNSSEWTTI